MGLRFRKSIKIAPGVRVNVSTRGTSLSVGKRGLTTNISRRGVRSTIGIPGSGISYTTRTARWNNRRNIANLPNRQFVNDASYRRVSFLLGMGIFFMPYIFAWFTLRQGYSRQARMISFFWLIILILPTFFKS